VAERLGMYHLRDDEDEGSRVVIMAIDRPPHEPVMVPA
jgi:hypothetical protein